ncbi:cation transporter [Gilvimarinus agarilyticus]|uniref:cation transporter n=1 Tax=Gilvimarinus sp. 2_MG-2023 TaxID=3062666 RepID=UPI001C08120D|nr:cation transporter [Gilvimarinus sp. 2_MG-2023]MBU2886778.1 cation transporter [Gilvimarinus agarilyticus]MDO6571443.1 cation transporter [Gilvimarinus sp. 2_MG-2023]
MTRCGCNDNHTAPSQPKPEMENLTQAASHVSVFHVPKMDCPSEENLIRTAFSRLGEAVNLEFDIPNRSVRVYHSNMATPVEKAMASVGLGATLISLESVGREAVQKVMKAAKSDEARESRVLRWLLTINAIMFILEFGVGIVAQSTGLIADSLDMFADAAVYCVSLFAVGKAAKLKIKAAHISGWLQLALGLGVLLEVLRRVIYGSEPVSTLMMSVGAVALAANITCLMLIFKSRNQGAHMKASWIFSANDVLANVGVITAGILVAVTESQIPDLVIGIIIGLVVLNGARRILLL